MQGCNNQLGMYVQGKYIRYFFKNVYWSILIVFPLGPTSVQLQVRAYIDRQIDVYLYIKLSTQTKRELYANFGWISNE